MGWSWQYCGWGCGTGRGQASDVKGVVPFLAAVDAFDWAVADAMFMVFG